MNFLEEKKKKNRKREEKYRFVLETNFHGEAKVISGNR